MRLETLSVDDIHVLALAEFEHDAIAVAMLNAAYCDSRNEYMQVLCELRRIEGAFIGGTDL